MVLVEERHGNTIADRIREVVDADIVAEAITSRLLLLLNQGCACEAEERCAGQAIQHILGEGVVLGAMRLISDDDDVIACRERGILLAGLLGAKFLDQGEDDLVILLL